MKKFIALFLVAVSSLAAARDIVTIVFAFGPGDNMATYNRALAEEANRIQSEYHFIFDTRPGAGSSIAAGYVKNNPSTILATSSAHFVRPVFYPKDSHRVEDFRSILPQCDAPMAVASIRYRSWPEVPHNLPLNIGITGLGAVSHLVATQIVSKYPNIQIIPFKSPSESILALLSGQLDFNIGFAAEMQQFKDSGKLTIIGVTGNSGAYPALADVGFSEILRNMNNPQHLAVPITTAWEKFQQWRNILYRASKSKSVRDRYAIDECVPLDDMATDQLDSWYQGQITRWGKLGATVKLER
jgi:tripartite-type tricarboxylate transporter receptor subunit TctC